MKHLNRPYAQTSRTVITVGAMQQLNLVDIICSLGRHFKCDWGNVSDGDWEANNNAVAKGYRTLSAYEDRNDSKFWIITEADMSVTTVLLPEDY